MNRQKILKLAKEKNCRMYDDGYSIYLEAPVNFVFALTDSSSTQSFIYGDEAWKKTDIYKELYEYLINGIREEEIN